MEKNIVGAVLELLLQREGEVVSVKSLARALGVSKRAVTKAARELKTVGFDVAFPNKKEYVFSLVQPLVLASKTEALRKDSFRHAPLYVEREIDSTNVAVKRLAEEGAPEGTCVVAYGQTAGKGRLGRRFHSPEGTGLYFSLLLRPKVSFQECRFLTAAAAVALCRAAEREGISDCGIKWVNDVYRKGKKACGILTEAAADVLTGLPQYAVLGVGVNLVAPKEGFPEELRQIAGTLSDLPVDASLFLAEFLEEFFAFYERLSQKEFLPEYRARSVLEGAKVTVYGGETPYVASVCGITDDFSLLVEKATGERVELSSGEVSVRPLREE